MSYPGYPAYPPQGPGQTGAPLPYPSAGSAAQSAPYPGGNPGAGAPYPGSNPPYPGGNPAGGAPYPGANPPYPGGAPGAGAPYPGSNPPYPGGAPGAGAPYPGSNPPYPGGTPAGGAPYPGSNPPYPGGAPGAGSPYPGTNPPYSGATPGAGAPYPGANPPYSGATPSSGSLYPSSSFPSASPYTASGSPYPPASSGYPAQQTSLPQQHSSYPNTYATPNYQGYQGGHSPNPAYSQQHLTSSGRAPTPTVRPANPFNARSDAEILRKAMKGFGTDEKAIISVLTKRTNAQRQQIALEFKTLYGKDLISNLKSEVSGKFEDLLMALMTPLPEFLAKELHHAVSGVGTKEETLVEIICTANNYEMKCIKGAYEMLYGRSLEQELAGDTSGYFRRLLVSLCQANRSEVFGADPNAALQDAEELVRAGVQRMGTDESTFNAILCSRSYSQLAAVFNEYQRLTGKDLESAIKSEFSGDIEAGLVAIVRTVRDKSGFFADELRASMAGAGTNDRALIRIIVSRSEIDLGDIKVAFQQRYGRTLSEAIHGDTSGHYKEALLSLIA